MSAQIYALGNDSIATVYRDGEFITQYQLRVKATNRTTSEVLDCLVSDFHNSPGSLFSWALKDLGLQKNNELIIVLNRRPTTKKRI